MADTNIKDFTLTWITLGVLIFALITFTLTFSFNNNPEALGQNEAQLQLFQNNISSTLTEIETDYNVQANVSAELNSEEASIGAASVSSTSYSFMGTSQASASNIKLLLAWIFAGTFGQFVIRVLAGIIGIIGLYYVIKLIRSIV